MTLSSRTPYPLTAEPWLLGLHRDGSIVELSLREAFEHASRLVRLVGDLPTQVFALTRLMLAVLHRALDGPRDVEQWRQLWQAPELPMDRICDYLAKYQDRFDLFHPEAPFFQVAGLRTARDEVFSLNRLIADVPNGELFFSIRSSSEPSLSFAEAARWLVHCHAFDPSGIKSGAVGDWRVKGGKGYPIGVGWSGTLGGVVPEGATLRETLLLNLIASDHGDLVRWTGDRPVWERPALGPTPRDNAAPTGPLDLYTWQSRRIRLVADSARVTAVVIANGDPLAPQNMQIAEPHSAWRRSQAQERKLKRTPIYLPREHQPERAIWHGLESLLPGAAIAQTAEAALAIAPIVLEWIGRLAEEGLLDPDQLLRLHTIGAVYGTQSAVITDVLDDALSVHHILLQPGGHDLALTALDAVSDAERGARAFGSLARNLAEADGVSRDDAAGHRDRARELAYAELDGPYRTWLVTLRPNTAPLDARQHWHEAANHVLRRLGADLSAHSNVSAWNGRFTATALLTSTHANQWFLNELRTTFRLAYDPADCPAEQDAIAEGAIA